MHRVRFAVEIVGCAAIGALAGVIFRHNSVLFTVAFVLGFGLCAGFLAHMVLGLRGRWRFHYVAICRFFSLALAGIVCFAAIGNVTDKSDKQAARDYLREIKPRIDDYWQTYGHYPDSLSEISGLPAPPPGFIYLREKDAMPGGPDTYRIDYFSLEYWSGTQQWFDDD